MRKQKRKRQRLKKLRLLCSVLFLVVLSFCIFKACTLFYQFYIDISSDRLNQNDAIPVSDTQAGNDDKEDKVNENVQEEFHGNQEIYDQLTQMITQDQRIQEIIQEYDSYPEALLEMLTRNIEMLDFVLDYPSKKGSLYATTIGSVQKGSIPFLLQWDERWGYASYGDSLLAISGCAPTALSMVIAGLTGNSSITPYTIAEYAENNGYYVSGTGSSWSLLAEGSSYFGIYATELSLSEDLMTSELESGNPIICSMRPGDFTTTGHFIVLTAMENGKFRVHDPNSIERSKKLWDYQTLEKQISNLWSYHL